MPCRPGICTKAVDCRDRHCPGHPLGAGEGGGYWPALHAEDNFQHLRVPVKVAVVKPLSVEYAEGSEPMSDFAKAIVIAAISLLAAACVAAVIFG